MKWTDDAAAIDPDRVTLSVELYDRFRSDHGSCNEFDWLWQDDDRV